MKGRPSRPQINGALRSINAVNPFAGLRLALAFPMRSRFASGKNRGFRFRISPRGASFFHLYVRNSFAKSDETSANLEVDERVRAWRPPLVFGEEQLSIGPAFSTVTKAGNSGPRIDARRRFSRNPSRCHNQATASRRHPERASIGEITFSFHVDSGSKSLRTLLVFRYQCISLKGGSARLGRTRTYRTVPKQKKQKPGASFQWRACRKQNRFVHSRTLFEIQQSPVFRLEAEYGLHDSSSVPKTRKCSGSPEIWRCAGSSATRAKRAAATSVGPPVRREESASHTTSTCQPFRPVLPRQ